MVIQVKAVSLFNSIMEKYEGYLETFSASRGWFGCFQKHSRIHNVRIVGESAVANREAALKFPDDFKKFLKMMDIKMNRLFGNNCLPKLIYQKKKNFSQVINPQKTA